MSATSNVSNQSNVSKGKPGEPFVAAVAKRLHDDIMSVGNTVDPGLASRHFRGRDPHIDALPRARGFAVSSPSAGNP